MQSWRNHKFSSDHGKRIEYIGLTKEMNFLKILRSSNFGYASVEWTSQTGLKWSRLTAIKNARLSFVYNWQHFDHDRTMHKSCILSVEYKRMTTLQWRRWQLKRQIDVFTAECRAKRSLNICHAWLGRTPSITKLIGTYIRHLASYLTAIRTVQSDIVEGLHMQCYRGSFLETGGAVKEYSCREYFYSE